MYRCRRGTAAGSTVARSKTVRPDETATESVFVSSMRWGFSRALNDYSERITTSGWLLASGSRSTGSPVSITPPPSSITEATTRASTVEVERAAPSSAPATGPVPSWRHLANGPDHPVDRRVLGGTAHGLGELSGLLHQLVRNRSRLGFHLGQQLTDAVVLQLAAQCVGHV